LLTSGFVTAYSEALPMNAQSVVMLVITLLTMVYLFYALLRPEKF